MKKLLIIANDAQACGKTTLMLILDEYLNRRQQRTAKAITAVDKELPERLEFFDVEESFQIQDLADLLQEKDAVIIDASTDGSAILGQSLRDQGLEDMLAEVDAELTVVVPICDDAEVLRCARQAAETYSGLGEFLVVRMPLAADFPETYEGSRTERVFNLLGAQLVTLPEIEQSTQMELDEMDLDIPLAMTQRGLLPRPLTHQLLVWEVAVGEQLKSAEKLIMPRLESPADRMESSYGRVLVGSK
jgi:hypothetical protein